MSIPDLHLDTLAEQVWTYMREGGSTASGTAIVHFGSVGRLCGLFDRSKAT